MKDFLHTKIGKYLRHFLIAVALVTISGGGILYFSQKIVYGAPVSTLLRNILPETTNRYDVGTTTNIWNRLFVNYASTTALNAVTLCLDGDTCRTTWPTGGSGGGDPFTHPSLTSSATTSLMLFNGGASTTLFSVFDKAYFGGTATSTFDSTGFLTLPNGYLSQASSTVVGDFTATGNFVAKQTTSGTPAYTFNNDTDTGIGRSAANTVQIISGTSKIASFDASFFASNFGTGGWSLSQDNTTGNKVTEPTYAFTSDRNTGMYRIAADTIGLSSGGEERFRIGASGASSAALSLFNKLYIGDT